MGHMVGAAGPTTKPPEGLDWEALAALSPVEIRQKDIYPYKALPHPAQGGGLGGQVFPQMQINVFPRLQRYDVPPPNRQQRKEDKPCPIQGLLG